MNKKILIGSMLVLTLLLLMPSIQAFQMNNIKNEIKQDFEEISLDDSIEPKYPDKFPLLFYLVFGLYFFRFSRCIALFEFATEPSYYFPNFEVVHPLAFFRCVMLFFTTVIKFETWVLLSEYFGWGWDIYE